MVVSGFIRTFLDRKRQIHRRPFALPFSWDTRATGKNNGTWAPSLDRADHSSADFFRIAKWKNGVDRPAWRGVTSRVYVAVQCRMQHCSNDKGTTASAVVLIALTYSSRSVRSLSRTAPLAFGFYVRLLILPLLLFTCSAFILPPLDRDWIPP